MSFRICSELAVCGTSMERASADISSSHARRSLCVAAKCVAMGSASSRPARRSALSLNTKSACSLIVASLARMSSASSLVVSCSRRLHLLIASLTASRRPLRSSWNTCHDHTQCWFILTLSILTQ